MKKFFKSIALAIALISVCITGGCNKNERVSVYIPDGAPAMAFSALMDEGMDEVEFRVVDPQMIAQKVNNKDKNENADFCVLPVTAASKLLGSGNEYQMLSQITGGNLYLVSKDASVISVLTAGESVDLFFMVGKTIGVMKINDMPGLTLKWSIENYSLEWNELNGGEKSTSKINLQAIEPQNIDASNTEIKAYLVAEPLVSNLVNNQGFTSVCSLDALYNRGKNEQNKGYPQAVLVAKKSVIANNPDLVKKLIEKVEQSAANAINLSGQRLESIVRANLEDENYDTTLKASALTSYTILRSGIRFKKAIDCKIAVQEYLQNIKSIDDKIQTVGDEFFYLG